MVYDLQRTAVSHLMTHLINMIQHTIIQRKHIFINMKGESSERTKNTLHITAFGAVHILHNQV